TPADEPGYGLASFQDAARRRVVGEAGVKGRDGRLGDVVGCREVRLPDLEVDDVPAGGLQAAGASEHLEGPLGAQAFHSFGKADRHVSSVVDHGTRGSVDTSQCAAVD